MLSKDLLSQVRKIEIRTRRIVDDITAGAYHSVFKGSGIEFDEVREYTPEDDVIYTLAVATLGVFRLPSFRTAPL